MITKLTQMTDAALLQAQKSLLQMQQDHKASWDNAPETHRIQKYQYTINPHFVELRTALFDELKKRNLDHA